MNASGRAFDAIADAHDHARWDAEQSDFDIAVWADLARLAVESDSPALFLGCGSAREARDYVSAGRAVSLVDHSFRMIQLARLRYGDRTNVAYHHQSAQTFVESTGERFGVVTGVGELLSYLDRPLDVLSRMGELLETGGSVAFTWVDAAALRPSAQDIVAGDDPESGVLHLIERERPPLTIAAWTAEYTAELLSSAGFSLCSEIIAETGPRRYCTATRSH